MKKILGCLVLVLCCSALIGVAAGCGDTTVDGPVPIMGTIGVEAAGPQVTYNKDTCNDNADCGSDELCTVDPAATKAVGYTIQVCVKGCDAELQTIETDEQNPDGTSYKASEVVKVEGTDTCQRTGDLTKFCDLTTHECKAYEAVEPTPEPTEPTPEPTEPTEPEPTEETSLTLVRCCYDGDVTGLYGQLAWSTSTTADPDSWGTADDLSFDGNGCVDANVDLYKVTIGFWIDVTTVIREDATPADWIGSSMKPTACTVGDESNSLGEFEQGAGWQFYDAAD